MKRALFFFCGFPAGTKKWYNSASGMLRNGENVIDGIPVEVERKRIRRINLRIGADGRVRLSVPKYWATLAEGEAFLREKWRWVVRKRTEFLSRPAYDPSPVTAFERRTLSVVLDELCREWSARLGEADVSWRVRAMKTQWGSCHWRKRVLTFNAELARAPRELVEYVVVHEFTHFRAHDHGPGFYELMDARLPGWEKLRARLNKRDFASPRPLVQGELW